MCNEVEPVSDYKVTELAPLSKQLSFDVQVVNQLQGSGESKKDGWRTELPKDGLGVEVIGLMKDEKQKDVIWQGKCSGTVYVFYYQYQHHIVVHW